MPKERYRMSKGRNQDGSRTFVIKDRMTGLSVAHITDEGLANWLRANGAVHERVEKLPAAPGPDNLADVRSADDNYYNFYDRSLFSRPRPRYKNPRFSD